VLAGGRSSRFGAEKALAELEGRSLFDRVFAVLAAGCSKVAVSAREGSQMAELAAARGLERLDDPPNAAAGPLSGVLAGLVWAQGQGADLLATAPCDTPLLPADLVQRLACAGRPVAVARAPDGLHPLCGLWRTSLAEPLAALLANGRHPPVRDAVFALGGCAVDFDAASAFANVNSRDDLARLAEALRRPDGG
jgi:molybdopterin-guanine dinucleotide biosynthesis protein A